ncbi:hypothetical protein KKI24_28810 [bacterium]|nr:hypothetical protein [bacterium]
MKHLKAIHLLIMLFFISCGAPLLQANPFSCKIKKDPVPKREQKTVDLSFMGYAIMENRRFAIIQLNNRQHILKQGESMGPITIIEFSADTLSYRINGTVFKTPINRDEN